MTRWENIYVLGGHKLALNYREKLIDAKTKGELDYENISCISQNPAEFILNLISTRKSETKNDIIVPDHTAKHLMLEVFMEMARRTWPTAKVSLTPFQSDFSPPFLKKGDNDSIWAMSYATWMCPPDCPEPEICPHTGENRFWDFNHSFSQLFKNFPAEDYSIHLFGCQPLFGEIAQIPLSVIEREFQKFAEKLKRGKPFRIVVATHSHCHAILGQFEINLSGNPSLACRLIQETPDFVFLCKEPGVHSVAHRVSETQSVANWLLSLYPELKRVGKPLEAGLVHRLDFDTSGVMVAARNKASYDYLKKLWKEGKVNKEYQCVVDQKPPPAGEYTAYACSNPRSKKQVLIKTKPVSSLKTKKIITQIISSEPADRGFLVRIRLVTGYRHQIRAHLAFLGCPIRGDKIYGGRPHERLMLQATKLSFADIKEHLEKVIKKVISHCP